MNNYRVKDHSSKDSTPFLQSANTAKALVNAAEREAAAIVQAAEEEAAEIIGLARSTAAEEQSQQETKTRLSTLFAWRTGVLRAKEDLISIAERIAGNILITEISTTPDSILRRIEAANELIEEQVGLTLEVSHSESKWISGALEKSPLIFCLNFAADLNPGEFRLKSKRCLISSSPSYHLQSLIKEFATTAPTFKQAAKKVLSDEND